ncbi:hypothetical protein V6N11_048897 [Hibiscus sabdariffa]|uniref:Uncharacterized protein n=1 Tax=Hibiscus sabdariffa TaxID=183260 RepID=A0ABR2PWK6_9ROSI
MDNNTVVKSSSLHSYFIPFLSSCHGFSFYFVADCGGGSRQERVPSPGIPISFSQENAIPHPAHPYFSPITWKIAPRKPSDVGRQLGISLEVQNGYIGMGTGPSHSIKRKNM